MVTSVLSEGSRSGVRLTSASAATLLRGLKVGRVEATMGNALAAASLTELAATVHIRDPSTLLRIKYMHHAKKIRTFGQGFILRVCRIRGVACTVLICHNGDRSLGAAFS